MAEQLKLRLSYGITGNQSIDPYSTFAMYGGGSIIYADKLGNALNTLTITNLANNSLKWEKTASWNVGVDFGFWNSRLTGTIDVYNKRKLQTCLSVGIFRVRQVSLQPIITKDHWQTKVEFSLNALHRDHKDWKWNVSGNIGVNKGKIGDLGMLPGQFGALGERVGYFGNSLGDHFSCRPCVPWQVKLRDSSTVMRFDGIVQVDDVVEGKGIRYTKADGTEGYYKTAMGQTLKSRWREVCRQKRRRCGDDKDKDIIGNPNPDYLWYPDQPFLEVADAESCFQRRTRSWYIEHR